MILTIKAYKLAVSPWLGSACRFTPSCSAYAQDAIVIHGAVRGAGLAARRLARCHPWGGSGYDPVPADIRRTTCHETHCHAPHRG